MSTSTSTSTSTPEIVLDPANVTVKRVIDQIRSDMRGGGKYGAYVAEFAVTPENVKHHALALARLVTPETAQRADGKRTRFGNAVQAAGNGLRAALKAAAGNDDDDDTDESKPVNLLTRAGLKASLDDVIAAWTAAQNNND